MIFDAAGIVWGMSRQLLRTAVRAVWPVSFGFSRMPLFRWMEPREAGRVWRDGARLAFRDWRLWTLAAIDLVATGEAIGTVAVTVRIVKRSLLGLSTPRYLELGAEALLWLFPIGIAALFVSTQLHFRLIYRHVLLAHPHRCRTCGYDLTATPERCPECGEAPEAARGPADAAPDAGR